MVIHSVVSVKCVVFKHIQCYAVAVCVTTMTLYL